MSTYDIALFSPAIRQMETQLVQAPNSGNGYQAICSATIVLNDGTRYTEIADASGNDTSGISESPVDAASMKAKNRVLEHVKRKEEQPGNYMTNEPSGGSMFDINPASAAKGSRAKAGGGGSKPISASQLKYISGLCQQQGKDPEVYAQDKFGKALPNLIGTEADILINILNGNRVS